MDYICSFCLKEFSRKSTLNNHQKTTKSCLIIQGKKDETKIKCENCDKFLALRSYKKHKLNCDNMFEKVSEILIKNEENEEKNKEINDYKNIIDIKERDISIEEYKNTIKERDISIEKYKHDIILLEKEVEKLNSIISILEKQNDKLHMSSTSISMKLAEKANTVNNINNNNNNNNNSKMLVINTNQLTNEVLRSCANTFSIDNAYNIKGIAKHLTSSLEDHVVCTDLSRNIFKYTNDKDEEIVDQDLENLLPQYLTAIKDRNNFFYKEVFEYFNKNNVSINVQTDYKIFYDALNTIIEKKGHNIKYIEKCKQYIVKECKRRFLDKNKNKDKTLTKNLSVDEIIMNIIETGGSVNDFIKMMFPAFLDDNIEETDDECKHRREMEDMFIKKKREYKSKC